MTSFVVLSLRVKFPKGVLPGKIPICMGLYYTRQLLKLNGRKSYVKFLFLKCSKLQCNIKNAMQNCSPYFSGKNDLGLGLISQLSFYINF